MLKHNAVYSISVVKIIGKSWKIDKRRLSNLASEVSQQGGHKYQRTELFALQYTG